MSHPPPTVLFVDDEAPILSALRRLFRPCGYTLLLAGSGAEALALLAQQPVDLVVSDMRMPGMNGAEFLQQVRERWPQTQRVLLTGYADISSTIAAINHGAIHRYVSKPWDDEDLLAVVREGLERSALMQENRRLQALTEAQNEALQQANQTLESRVAARTAELEQLNGMLEAAYGEMEHNFRLSLEVFAGLLELHEQGAAGLAREVAALARDTGAQLGLAPRELQDLYAAGLLHGIGRLSLPEALLRRPLSALSADELARYRRHPLAGEAALLPMAALQRVARLVRAQLERVDGQGTPDGLGGDDLPLTAQVLSASLDYCSLRAGRLSERRHTAESALQVLRGQRGTHQLPRVVEALDAALQARPDRAAQAGIEVQALQPGMVLSRDLIGPRGTLLLAAGFCFEQRVIHKVQELVRREGLDLRLHVQWADGRPVPAPASTPGSAAPAHA
jgi:response regulator RpfG family c-di-GMP phosphodiesterase